MRVPLAAHREPAYREPYSSSICEIVLYNQQLVVLTYELIHIVRAAHH